MADMLFSQVLSMLLLNLIYGARLLEQLAPHLIKSQPQLLLL
jgi:hypothetical protein